jgi:hypothetical protein
VAAGAEGVPQERHVILVSAKKDLRTDDATLLKLSQESQEPVQTIDDKAQTNEIKAMLFESQCVSSFRPSAFIIRI